MNCVSVWRYITKNATFSGPLYLDLVRCHGWHDTDESRSKKENRRMSNDKTYTQNRINIVALHDRVSNVDRDRFTEFSIHSFYRGISVIYYYIVAQFKFILELQFTHIIAWQLLHEFFKTSHVKRFYRTRYLKYIFLTVITVSSDHT